MAFLPLPVIAFQTRGRRIPCAYVLQATNCSAPRATAVSELVIRRSAGALAEAGHQVTLLYLFRDWCENGTISEWEATLPPPRHPVLSATHVHSSGRSSAKHRHLVRRLSLAERP